MQSIAADVIRVQHNLRSHYREVQHNKTKRNLFFPTPSSLYLEGDGVLHSCGRHARRGRVKIVRRVLTYHSRDLCAIRGRNDLHRAVGDVILVEQLPPLSYFRLHFFWRRKLRNARDNGSEPLSLSEDVSILATHHTRLCLCRKRT